MKYKESNVLFSERLAMKYDFVAPMASIALYGQ